MASKNLVLKGATWNGIESVDFPVSGGGTARYVETSDADATAADIASGKKAYVNGSLVTGTASGGGGGLVYETGTYTPESDIVQPTISFTNTHTNPPISIIFYDATGTDNFATDTSWSFVWVDYEQFGGATVSWSSTVVRYASMYSWYRGTSTTALSTTNAPIIYPYSDTDDGSNICYRYWVTASGFKPSSNSSSRYWRSGRTYKWIAIWAPTTS